jgi:DNA-binding MarR family transcriptional regulator
MSGDAAFDELIHAPKRLRICAMLGAAAAVEFATLRDAIEVSDSVLSKQLSSLEAAGYVTVSRQLRASRQRVWVSLTREGERAYAAHVRALRQIIADDHRRGAGPTGW